MTKSVIFDLGGVVIDWNPDRILESCYPEPGLRARMKRDMFQHPDWLDLDRGTLSELHLVERASARTGRSITELETVMQAVRESLHVKPETVELLNRLHARGVPLYCLSNISSDIFAYLRKRHAFWDVFRDIVISGDIRMLKPERQIFEHVLRRFGLQAHESAFIDDNAPNIDAAAELGIHPILFKSAAQCEKEIEVFLATN